MDVHGAVEKAARDSYGRLLAFLSARARDVAAAEDALADAFHAALATWPRTGVPDKPEAWLLTAARRRLVDHIRHAQVQSEAIPTLVAASREAQMVSEGNDVFPDERLKLLFICAHPAIDVAARTPLMLQVVLGLDAARIASAFLVRPSTMGQRLTRAKTKIRDAGIRFELPGVDDLPGRLDSVLEAIYAGYGSGWDDVAGGDPRRKGLAAESVALCRLLRDLMPGEPEILGLLALMLHCEARREARRSGGGDYVPLSEQDVTLWSRHVMEEAECFLSVAAEHGRTGRFQLEAAIQSVFAQRARTGSIDWDSISLLYEGLVRMAPTMSALVGRAAAVGEALGAPAGWMLLQGIPGETYQPYWALAAHLLRQMGRQEDASAAYGSAIGLCEDAAVRRFLIGRRESLTTRPA